MTRLNVTEARCEALFASWLQPSDAPTASVLSDAISRTVRQLGIAGCAGRMAQEFGDHPEAARDRMRWIRQLAGEVPGGSPPATGRAAPGAAVTRGLDHRDAPAGAMPAGAVPAGAVPAGAVPAGAMPAGAMPAGAMPAGPGAAGPRCRPRPRRPRPVPPRRQRDPATH